MNAEEINNNVELVFFITKIKETYISEIEIDGKLVDIGLCLLSSIINYKIEILELSKRYPEILNEYKNLSELKN